METETRQIHNFHEGDRFHEHYRLLEHVGSGGFADVWKAKDELVDTIVALKIYTRLDKEGISELAKEYKDMRGIKHPNLLTGNHFDASGNIPYLEMDYCDGGSLFNKIGKMTNQELRRMVGDVANGLAYLHKEGIVHQDIKPENILYNTEHNRYLLSDFGISSKSRTRLSKSVNKANMTLSMTEAYAPPEKFSGNMGDLVPDVKGDIFSLGMTIFELAVGQLPFEPPMATGREMLMQHGQLRLDYSRISDPLLRGIVVECTHFVKSERLSADDVLDILAGRKAAPKPPNQEQAGTSGSVKPPTVKVKVGQKDGDGRSTKPEPPSPPNPNPKPNRTGLYVGIVAVVAVAVVVALFAGRGGGGGGGVSDTTLVKNYDTRYGQWTGPEVGGKPTGEGVLTYYSDDKDGRSKYEGNMKEGKREDDDAVLKYSNGNTYKGSFVGDKFGKGRMTLKADGLYFDGEFRNDEPYNGTWYWDDGSEYSRVKNGVETVL